MRSEERSAYENGVWLCQICAKVVDDDDVQYTAGLLGEWRADAESRSNDEVGKPRPAPAAPHEVARPQMARRKILEAVCRDQARRRVLGDLGGARVRLESVWVDVRQVAGAPGTPDALVECDLLADIRAAGSVSPPPVFSVIGDVGAGKTELLLTLAAKLAADAVDDPSSPIPLLLRARDLRQRAWYEAAGLRWPGLGGPINTLVEASADSWVLLVDGIDEAGAPAGNDIERLQDVFGGRLNATVLASRPGVRPGLRGEREVWLSEWNEAESELHRRRWHEARPSVVTSARAGDTSPAIRALLRTPLTATLCLTAMAGEHGVPRSRAALFQEVIDLLVHDWVARRFGENVDARWGRVLPTLRKVALEHVRSGAPVSVAQVRSMLRSAFDGGGREVEQLLTRELGVLVRRGAAYDFVVRAFAEHLAGQELAAKTDGELADSARAAWAAEPVRHAVGWLGETCASRVPQALGSLLRDAEMDRPGLRNEHLRGVLCAVRSAADVGEPAHMVSAALAEAALARLADEESIWVGDRVAEAVRELAAAGGACWKALEGEVLSRITSPLEPADWYAARPWDDQPAWLELQYHRDPRVRAVCAERLARWVDVPSVRSALTTMLADRQARFLVRPPAVAAAWALRGAARDASFESIRNHLLTRISDGSQLAASAAAAALRPEEVGENARRTIAKAVEDCGNAYRLPATVLEEWELNATGAPAPRSPAASEGPLLAPPSGHVRARLAHAIGPVLHQLTPEERRHVLRQPGLAGVESLCELGNVYPSLLTEVLTAEGLSGVLLPQRAQEWLGAAALRHEPVRARIFGLWQECRGDRHLAHRYPAHALEALIRDGDAEAARVYAEWLPSWTWLTGLTGGPAPARDVIAREPIRTEAVAIAATMLSSEPSEGLAPRAAGPILGVLAAVWRGHRDWRDRVIAWTESSSESAWARGEEFNAALSALQHVELGPAEREMVSSRLIELFGSASGDVSFLHTQAGRLLELASTCGLAPQIGPLLEALSTRGGMFSPQAGSLLAYHELATDLGTLSGDVSSNPWAALNPGRVHNLGLRLLVDAAPESWVDALRQGLRTGAATPSATVTYMMALPRALRIEVAQYWLSLVADHELPWVSDDLQDQGAWRPADRVRGMLFDLGVDPAAETS